MEKIPVRHINSNPKVDFFNHFTIVDLQDLLSGKDRIEELHRHDFFYILVLKKGIGFHNIDFVNYEMKDNTAFLLRPGQAHRLELNAECTGFMLKFNADFYHADNLRKAGRQNFYSFGEKEFQRIISVLNYIADEYQNKRENYTEIIKANLSIFFTELVREQKVSEPKNLYAQERLDEFTALLEKHIFTIKQVSAYAEMLNLTPYQLNAVTKTSLNKTASELITDAVILESKRYLLATANQVTQIAFYMGYHDASYFARFFKKHTGFSPEAFRQNFK